MGQYKRSADDTICRVVIPNLEDDSRHEFWLVDRIHQHLHELATQVTPDQIPESWGEGVDSMAVCGMSFLFDTIPMKFPVQSILTWLETTMRIPASTLEVALGKLAVLYA